MALAWGCRQGAGLGAFLDVAAAESAYQGAQSGAVTTGGACLAMQ